MVGFFVIEGFCEMGNLLEYKSLEGKVVDIDSANRRIVMNWSATDEIDHDNDLITRSAYSKTIKERGPEGSNLVYWLTDHHASVTNVPGKIESLKFSGNHLQAIGVASKTTLGNDVMQLYSDGIIRQHSVGFIPVKSEKAKDHRVITEVMLFEGSSVLWGANSNTGTVSVGKSLKTIDETHAELDSLLKAFKNGQYSEETFSLLELRIKQIQKHYSELIPQPDSSTVENQPSTGDTEVKKNNLSFQSFSNLKL